AVEERAREVPRRALGGRLGAQRRGRMVALVLRDRDVAAALQHGGEADLAREVLRARRDDTAVELGARAAPVGEHAEAAADEAVGAALEERREAEVERGRVRVADRLRRPQRRLDLLRVGPPCDRLALRRE